MSERAARAAALRDRPRRKRFPASGSACASVRTISIRGVDRLIAGRDGAGALGRPRAEFRRWYRAQVLELFKTVT